MQKYHNYTAVVNGERFDSRKEARRYAELLLLQKAGKISDLRRQVEYELIPAQHEDVLIGYYQRGEKAGQPRYKSVCIEKAARYIADFVYMEKTTTQTLVNGEIVEINGWREVVEDTKGVRTPDYILKRKLMLYLKQIKIREV